MRFVEKCRNLIVSYGEDYLKRKNETLLLHPGKIPVASHIIHAPLKREVIEEYLVNAYKNKMPDEYIKLLSNFNGMTLYMVRVNFQNRFSFACSRFTIYGLPLTPTSVRKEFGEEPYDVRMMDLERHNDISPYWLKIGAYRKYMEEDIDYDIFVDTNDNKVYCCKSRTTEIDAEWKCIDDCLCDIFDYLSTTEWEFEM